MVYDPKRCGPTLTLMVYDPKRCGPTLTLMVYDPKRCGPTLTLMVYDPKRCGPTLTLMVYDPEKRRPTLTLMVYDPGSSLPVTVTDPLARTLKVPARATEAEIEHLSSSQSVSQASKQASKRSHWSAICQGCSRFRHGLVFNTEITTPPMSLPSTSRPA